MKRHYHTIVADREHEEYLTDMVYEDFEDGLDNFLRAAHGLVNDNRHPDMVADMELDVREAMDSLDDEAAMDMVAEKGPFAVAFSTCYHYCRYHGSNN